MDDPAYDLRSQFCSIIIEPSVYQPDTLCESITSDMQSRQAAADFNLPFVDLDQYNYNGDTSRPFITETGCYNACSVNFAGLVPGGTSTIADETAATFRRKYWTNLAVKDPRAWSLSVLRNLNEDQVSSGTFDVLPSGDDGGDRGDWGEIPVLLTNFPVHGNPDIINAWPQLGLIITSIKFTAETCQKIGAAFKTAGEFRGSSLPINPLDYDVCLDLGLYSDQHSDVTNTLANGTGRQRFKSVSEVRADPTNHVLRVDVGPTVCLDRDGQPGNALLPQLWVKSRWSDSYSVDNAGRCVTATPITTVVLSHCHAAALSHCQAWAILSEGSSCTFCGRRCDHHLVVCSVNNRSVQNHRHPAGLACCWCCWRQCQRCQEQRDVRSLRFIRDCYRDGGGQDNCSL